MCKCLETEEVLRKNKCIFKYVIKNKCIIDYENFF